MIRDKEQEISVIKKAKNFVSFKFGGVQILDIMKLLGGATTLDSFLKDYKTKTTNETRKEFSSMSGLITQASLNFPNCYLMYPFSVDLRINKEFIDYEKLRQY